MCYKVWDCENIQLKYGRMIKSKQLYPQEKLKVGT